jgi:hypothetical protein
MEQVNETILPPRLFVDRIAGRHGHHRYLDWLIGARGAKSARGGVADAVPEQHEADRTRVGAI